MTKNQLKERKQFDRFQEMWEYEKNIVGCGHSIVAGVDEAGRGPLAGPVVAAAVVLPENFSETAVNDSKKLSEKVRESLYQTITAQCLGYGVSIVDNTVIDEINIVQANNQAMRQAVANLYTNLGRSPDIVLIDGNTTVPGLDNQLTIIKGDSKTISIACASIIAKVTRDRIMRAYDVVYPGYGFAQHKGYGTKNHIQALLSYGPTPLHRKLFIRKYCT